MINLIKNELIKIFHRKGIYILSLIILAIIILNIIITISDVSNNLVNNIGETYYTMLEENIDSYNLNNKEEITNYIDDKTELDIHNLNKEYEYSSPIYYFIDNKIEPVLRTMYIAKYETKNEIEYRYYKEEYDSLVKKIENYDWHQEIVEEKNTIEKDINELEEELKNNNNEELESRISILKYQLEGIEYRLRNDIAPSYTEKSTFVSDYINSATTYTNLNKDESKYLKRAELITYRETVKEYKEAKYKLDNDIVVNGYDSLQGFLINIFTSTDPFIIIAFLIIAGGIIAEEFNKGTIKQLLLRPFTRNKILTSKIIASLIATLIFAIFYYGINIMETIVSYKEFESIFDPIIIYNFNKETIQTYNIFSYCLLQLLAILPEYIMLFAICIFVGVLTTNTVGTVVSVFGVSFLNGLLTSFLPEKMIAFLPTNCMNFNQFLFGGIASNQYQTLGGSITVYIVTLAVIVFFSYTLFNKKDIKNQ